MKPHEYVILEIARERERQMAEEGWSPEHDDKHDCGELSYAAACYAMGQAHISRGVDHDNVRATVSAQIWPWDHAWWKPGKQRRNLVKAAALLVAEIERLDRAALAKARAHQAGGAR